VGRHARERSRDGGAFPRAATIPPRTSRSSAGEQSPAGRDNARPPRRALPRTSFRSSTKRVIESLRQPLEGRPYQRLSFEGLARFPARFILIAAMNPCPCGFLRKSRTAMPLQRRRPRRYRRKLSGPLIDRIDLWISVEAVEYEKARRRQKRYAIVVIQRTRERGQGAAAEALRRERAADLTQQRNGRPRSRRSRHPQTAGARSARDGARRLGLSARGYHKALKLARTIADLEGTRKFPKRHILESLQFRPRFEGAY